jgi:hypothetical protein
VAGTGFVDWKACWEISGVCDPEAFFRAVPLLVPDATHLLLEGAPCAEVAAVLAAHEDAQRPYEARHGTIFSLPKRNRRFTLRASPALYAALREAGTRHAGLEMCFHLRLYQNGEPLLQWFDAFSDPILVRGDIPRIEVERFSSDTGGVISASPVGE